MKIFRGCLLLVTGFLMTACEEEPAPTAWDFDCELEWYHDNPQDNPDEEPISTLTLGPYEDLGSADEAVDMCAAEQEDHEQRPPHAFFYKCECAVVGDGESE